MNPCTESIVKPYAREEDTGANTGGNTVGIHSGIRYGIDTLLHDDDEIHHGGLSSNGILF
jgi:hypothetical protein